MAKAKSNLPAKTGTVIMPEDLPAPLAQILTKLRLKVAGLQTAILSTYYETGVLLKPVSSDHTKYGANAISRLEEQSGISKEQLYKMISFTEKYNKAQLEELCALQSPRGKHLTWGHVCHLLSVNVAETRYEWARKAADGEWTSDELLKALQAKRGNLRAGSGRKFAQPKDLKQGVANLSASVNDYVKRKAEVWEPMLEQLAEKTEDSFTAEDVVQLDDMEASVEKLQTTLTSQLKTLTKVREHIKQAIKERGSEEDEEE